MSVYARGFFAHKTLMTPMYTVQNQLYTHSLFGCSFRPLSDEVSFKKIFKVGKYAYAVYKC